MTTLEGGHTFDQALKLRRLFNDFDCDYIVIDTQGVGICVYDNLVQEQIDNERVEVYPAWSCINDEGMANRCKDISAPRIIYSIKASMNFNSECAVSLRDVIRRGKLKLLMHEQGAIELLRTSKAYNSLEIEKQIMFQEPFYQTTALVNEMVNLSFEIVNGQVRVMTDHKMRKDRFSSLAYANFIANTLERQQSDRQNIYEFQTFIN